MIYVIAAVLIFGILIMIHELGHFTVARLCGVYIKEFSIGMGPKLLQKKSKKRGTLYSLRAFPIGGYVSMKGEEEDEEGEDSFTQKKVWQRMAIVVAGALMNLLLGFLIVFIIVCISKNLLASTRIHSFLDGSTSNTPTGLQIEDTVIKVNHISVYTGEELTYEIMNQGHEPVDLTVIRNGEKVVLEDVVFPQFEDQGIVFGESDFKVWAFEDPSLWQLLRVTWRRSVSLVKMVWDSLFNLITGRFSVSSLSSPIGVTAAVKDTISQSGWNPMQILQYVLNITAVISINLGVFNLIPFPALDGGRFLFLGLEGIFRKPIISRDLEAKINFAGIVLLMIVMVLVLSKDIIALFL
ncbi:MAG: site-2 protease family protein [Clostridia bacterium]|nr:site-2 protease family protein [Clostridia bacterium]